MAIFSSLQDEHHICCYYFNYINSYFIENLTSYHARNTILTRETRHTSLSCQTRHTRHTRQTFHTRQTRHTHHTPRHTPLSMI